MRANAPLKDGIPGIDRSAFGTCFNTQKFSMSLDLTKPRAKEVAKRLFAWADVVNESFTPGTMKKLGLDYEEAKKVKPDIIYCSTCQMGQQGPLSTFGGYGASGVAYSGFSYLTGWPDRDPNYIYNNHSDFIAPWYLTMTLVAALAYHRKTGKGLYLDQSQVEAGSTFLGPLLLDYMINGRVAQRTGNYDPYEVPHAAYPCLGHDRWVSITVSTEEEWQAFCKVIGQPEWSRETRFSTFRGRKENEDELDCLIAAWTIGRNDFEVMTLLQAAGVPAGVVETCEDLFHDPQLKHRQHFRFLQHTVIGRHAYHSPAYRLSRTPNHIWKAAPCLGEDNEYVYKQVLGYSDDEVADLLVEGVITTETDVPDFMKLKRR
jgi:benzylsuccinate CoA-transferase BbsF subunit